MANFKNWISAFRLRTLPLSLAPVIIGTGLAQKEHILSIPVFILTLCTTLCLQILSNLANDYGDYIKGTDNENRIGEKRALQSGIISKQQMKTAIIIFSGLSFVSGLVLLLLSYEKIQVKGLLILLSIGLLCIAAAITYTIGKKSYGYRGMGDVFVFLFFGITGVCGTYYLQTAQVNYFVLMPAAAIGLLSAGVLNINNMRDVTNDRASGKKTLVVKLGIKRAKNYHAFLLVIAMLMFIAYTYLQMPKQGELVQFIYLVTFPLFIMNIIDIYETEKPEKLDSKLKPLALATFACSLLFALGLILAYL